MKPLIRRLLTAGLLTVVVGSSPVAAQSQDQDTGMDEPISEITVRATRVANTRPAGTFASVATVLRFDPQTELQSRGLPEGQADVTVRGGLFENTGFKVGAITIMDPQTGHYAAELPVDPALISPPGLLTGIDNGLAGFNSSIATVSYEIPAIAAGGAFEAGTGSDALRFAAVRSAWRFGDTDKPGLAAAVSAAGSSGDGTIENGDHEFLRYNLQLQRTGSDSQSDLIVSYQDKFYGWPGAYTGFPSLAETDDTQASLLIANHRAGVTAGWWQVGAYFRRLVDDYDFDRTTREAGGPGAFDHETQVAGLGLDAVLVRGGLDWHLAAQLAADELVRSTDLTNGDFESRTTATVSLVPTYNFATASGLDVGVRFGATVDVSNRDDNAISPLLGIRFERTGRSATRFVSLQYATTTQLPGYTALASGPSGLFGGNPDLGREKARQLIAALGMRAMYWRGTLTVFHRQDIDLVDWTFSSDSLFTRQANPVDIDVSGVEILYAREFGNADIGLGYTWLDKDADYGPATVDASFYALNFARHRATLSLHYRLPRDFELRFDAEYRDQEANVLRASSDEALVVAASLGWQHQNGFGLALIADNITDDDFQTFPGTPAVGRQLSVRARYAW